MTSTIIQKLHRGTMDKKTAAVMKRLAKNKLEHAIADREYGAREGCSEETAEQYLHDLWPGQPTIQAQNL